MADIESLQYLSFSKGQSMRKDMSVTSDLCDLAQSRSFDQSLGDARSVLWVELQNLCLKCNLNILATFAFVILIRSCVRYTVTIHHIFPTDFTPYPISVHRFHSCAYLFTIYIYRIQFICHSFQLKFKDIQYLYTVQFI